jgi:hypothetical protein
MEKMDNIKPSNLSGFSLEDIEEAKNRLKEIAKENGYELSGNLESIAKAKLRFFGLENLRLCPCDRNSDRACVSEHCKQDIEKDGICHCSLMKKG